MYQYRTRSPSLGKSRHNCSAVLSPYCAKVSPQSPQISPLGACILVAMMSRVSPCDSILHWVGLGACEVAFNGLDGK